MKKRGARLGQHFLTSRAVVKRILDVSGIQKTDTVLEIGPGEGILTEELIARAGRVVAIEKDAMLARKLREKFAEKDNLVLIEGDIRTILKKPEKYGINLASLAVIANIPYYLTGQLFRSLVSDTETVPRLLVLMVQKEVAERATAREKTNLLALSLQPFVEAQNAFRVSRGQFNPPPNVDSAILILKRRTRSLLDEQTIPKKRYFALLRAAFCQKRKIALSTLKKKRLSSETAFSQCAVPLNARPEDISSAQWLCITKKSGE